MAILAALVAMVGTSIACSQPLARVSEDLKVPVLEGLARAGLENVPADFAAPVYDEARRIHFGAVTGQTFTNLFHGKDAGGHGYAGYEACLQRRVGKNTATIFLGGQLYGLQCRAGRQGCTAIVPDKGMFNFFKPAGDMQRVNVEQDPAFE